MNVFTVTWNDADPELWGESVGHVEPFAAFKTMAEAVGAVATVFRDEANEFIETGEYDDDGAPVGAGDGPIVEWLGLIAVGYGDEAIVRQVGADGTTLPEADASRWALTVGDRWPGDQGVFIVTRIQLGKAA